jgi:hypothetical protein
VTGLGSFAGRGTPAPLGAYGRAAQPSAIAKSEAANAFEHECYERSRISISREQCSRLAAQFLFVKARERQRFESGDVLKTRCVQQKPAMTQAVPAE